MARSEAWRGASRDPRVPSPPAPVKGPPLVATLPARLLLVASTIFIVLLVVEQAIDVPAFVDLFRRVVGIIWLGTFGWVASLTVLRNRQAFLWRVRRKLILSYIFFGVVPFVLVVAFVLVGGMLLYMTVAQYVFAEGLSDLSHDVQQIADTTALELSRSSTDADVILSRKYDNYSPQYPGLSIAVVPASADASPSTGIVMSGPWTYLRPPTSAPAWLKAPGVFSGVLVNGSAGSMPLLIIRAAVPVRDRTRTVVVDVPVDSALQASLEKKTGARIATVSDRVCGPASAAATPVRDWSTLYSETVAFVTCVDWTSGQSGRLALMLEAPVSAVYSHLASSPDAGSSADSGSWWRAFIQLLIALGALFLVIQASAIVMGVVLARSITSAVHELFVGTERVREGDFSHRIGITSRDQLGDLAQSFNRMSASVERLLHVEREKQRLDDELRIARDIQKSLLPVQPPRVAGIDLADLCEPAREVGGDYYDFFELGPRVLGVLIADVSGKGTSAALYMAELRGVMLALSHTERSPRQLLVDVNQRLVGHLDTRSFITMTYAIVDLERGTLTAARAGHTPLLIVSNGQARSVAPDGMVVGLRIPGAIERFDGMLTEYQRPVLPGDVIVVYTDGITEAMNAGGDLFGESALAEVVARHAELPAAGIREQVLRAVSAFVGKAEPHDDMTMIVIKIGDGER